MSAVPTSGADERREFAVLTDTLSRGTFDLTTAEHRTVKQLPARQNLRDSMTPLELVLTSLAEVTATDVHQQRESQGFPALRRDAQEAGGIAGDARRSVEAALGRPVVSPTNYKQLRQERQRELQRRCWAKRYLTARIVRMMMRNRVGGK